MPKDKFEIQGLSGQKKLRGEIEVKGSKNAVLPVMASSILFEDSLKLENIPNIEDVFRMSELLEELGIKVENDNSGGITISSKGSLSSDLNEDLSRKMRASIILAGPILARFGKVSFPHPGGCVIGKRPIDLFIEGFSQMGATVEENKKGYIIKSKGKKLKGVNLFFPVQSVTATETFMMAGVLAEGKTILKNVAFEPEIVSLGEFLNSCGADIKGLGTPTLEIKGGNLLKAGGKSYKAIPDRLEAGCFLILGALAAEDLLIKNCNPDHIEVLIDILKKSGVSIDVSKNSIRVKNKKDQKPFVSFNVKTHEYPGFPTDLQAPIGVFLTQSKGQAIVFETIFESRLNYIEDLIRMGADITMFDPHRIMIKGPALLKGRELEGLDIRSGLAFIIAAIIAKGSSVINNIYYIDRGYEKIEDRLQKIGVKIERINN